MNSVFGDSGEVYTFNRISGAAGEYQGPVTDRRAVSVRLN